MSWLRTIAAVAFALAFVCQPASASAFVPASPEARVEAFEVVASTLVGGLGDAGRGLHQGIGAAYDEIASGYRFAAGGSGGGRTLYRAVGPDELADIQATGRYRVPAGGTEGKYFFETPEQASNFARMMGDQPYTTTSVRVSPSQLGRGQPINPAREGPSYFFDTPDVPSGLVTIFNYSVVP